MTRAKNPNQIFTRGKLTQFLIAKSIVEALLVTALGIAFYLVVTSPSLRGWLDQANDQTISGWVVDERSAGSRVEVQLFVDDRFIESRFADVFRPDVREAQRAADDWHGFVFKTPLLAPGDHEARVYAIYRGRSPDRRVLRIIGNPLKFRIDGNRTDGGAAR